MKRSILILSILLLSFSMAFAAGAGGAASGGTGGGTAAGGSGANATSTSSATATGGPGGGANANNIGTVNAGTTTTSGTGTTTGTVGSATIAPTTVGTTTTGTTTTTAINQTGPGLGITPADVTTLFNNFVAANQLGNLSTVQLNSLFTQFRTVITNPAMNNGLIVNPLTGQQVNVFANPFNTGLGTVTTAGTTVVQTGAGNLAAFPQGSFPNGVGLNVNFPLNTATIATSGTTTLINPNKNLTGGAGSIGFTSSGATSNGSTAGLRFPTLTLGSRGLVFDTIPRSNIGMGAQMNGARTNTTGIIQRRDGTFTNVQSPRH